MCQGMPKLTSACARKRNSNKETLCNADEVLYCNGDEVLQFQQNLLEQQSQESGKKRQLWCQKKPPAKRFEELAEVFRIMSLSALLIKVWKALQRVYEVHSKRKQTLLPTIALKELI